MDFDWLAIALSGTKLMAYVLLTPSIWTVRRHPDSSSGRAAYHYLGGTWRPPVQNARWRKDQSTCQLWRNLSLSLKLLLNRL